MTKTRSPIGLIVCLGVAIVALAPESALACPICFGASDAPAAQGMNMAIFTLLGVTGGVLGSFLGFIAYLFKRARMLRQGQEWHESLVDSQP